MGGVQIQMYDQYDVTLVHFHKKRLTCRLFVCGYGSEVCHKV